MKKLIPLLSVLFIILLFVISSRFVFFISFVKSQKATFRKQLIELKSSTTKTLIFSEEGIYKNGRAFEWKEKNKELVINGVYHEVLSVKKINDTYQVTIIEDKAENELFSGYFSLNKQAKNSLKELTLLFLSFNYLEGQSILIPQNFIEKSISFPSVIAYHDTSYSGKLLKPPGIIYYLQS